MSGTTAIIHLIRHGETEWSRTRRHTGTTDIELTADGRGQAEALGTLLAAFDPTLVLTSPLRRAVETCRLAGLGDAATVDPRLAEWDYGSAEGRTTAEIRAEDPGWSVWDSPIVGGESLAQVAARVDPLVDELKAVGGVAVLFAHAHLFRILAARWCGLEASTGRHLMLDPAGVSTLGFERETPTIVGWNRPPIPRSDQAMPPT